MRKLFPSCLCSTVGHGLGLEQTAEPQRSPRLASIKSIHSPNDNSRGDVLCNETTEVNPFNAISITF